MSDILRSVDIKKAEKDFLKDFDISKYAFGLDKTKIAEKLVKIKNIIFNDKVTIYFIPSPYLREQVSSGKNPLLKNMPDIFKAMIIGGKGIVIQKMMVYKWLTGKLDKNNAFVLSNGELRVTDDNYPIIDSSKEKK